MGDRINMKEHSEYQEVLEALLKTTGNYEVFKSFEEKLQNRTTTPQQTKQIILTLTSLAPAISNQKFKEEIYQKIIEELVLMVFNVTN